MPEETAHCVLIDVKAGPLSVISRLIRECETLYLPQQPIRAPPAHRAASALRAPAEGAPDICRTAGGEFRRWNFHATWSVSPASVLSELSARTRVLSHASPGPRHTCVRLLQPPLPHISLPPIVAVLQYLPATARSDGDPAWERRRVDCPSDAWVQWIGDAVIQSCHATHWEHCHSSGVGGCLRRQRNVRVPPR